MWDDYYREAYQATADDAHQCSLEDAGFKSQEEFAAHYEALVAEAGVKAAYLEGVKVWDANCEDYDDLPF